MTLAEKYQVALAALADIAYAEDLTPEQRRHKADRIYQELVADEDESS